MSDTQLAYIEQRRSTRLDQAIPLMVHGADLSRAPYKERVSTLTISGHGCRYRTKYELIQGDVVFLDVKESDKNSLASPTRARVKWLHPVTAGDERAFEVAVELEAPGNIWGIASPPRDWPAGRELESAVSRRALQVVDRPQQPTASLAHLMVGLGEQIQMMASEAATDVLITEKSRLLADFRVQLQGEATRILESVIAASKEEMAVRAVKELSEAHENNARTIHERWLAKMENELKEATQRIGAHGTEVSTQVENMALGTIERLRHNMDASRRDAVDQCLALLRKQLVPLLTDVQTALETLAASEDNLKIKALAICNQFEEFLQQGAGQSTAAMQESLAQFRSQFDESNRERLAASQEDLEKRSAAVTGQSAQALHKLSEESLQAAQSQLQALIERATEQMNSVLQEKVAEISRQCSAELEGNTRSHLDFISESIAEIAKRRAIRTHD